MVIRWGRTGVLTSVEAYGTLGVGKGSKAGLAVWGRGGVRLPWLRLQKRSLGVCALWWLGSICS